MHVICILVPVKYDIFCAKVPLKKEERIIIIIMKNV